MIFPLPLQALATNFNVPLGCSACSRLRCQLHNNKAGVCARVCIVSAISRNIFFRDASERRQRLALGESQRAALPALLQVMYRLKISASHVTPHTPHISHLTFHTSHFFPYRIARVHLRSWMEHSKASKLLLARTGSALKPRSNSHVKGLLAAHLETAPSRLVIDHRDTLTQPPHKLPQAHTNIFTGIQAPTVVNIALSSGRITLKVFTLFYSAHHRSCLALQFVSL
jgi:hypothetical protein